MIKLATEPYQSFIDYLNNQSFTAEPCEIVILPEHITVGPSIDDGEPLGFAMYSTITKTIYVCANVEEFIKIGNDKDSQNYQDQFGGNVTKEEVIMNIYKSIAHEYKHHLQNVVNKCDCYYDEDEAEEFAVGIVNEFLKEVLDK